MALSVANPLGTIPLKASFGSKILKAFFDVYCHIFPSFYVVKRFGEISGRNSAILKSQISQIFIEGYDIGIVPITPSLGDFRSQRLGMQTGKR